MLYCFKPKVQDPMVLIGELVKALNLYSNLGIAHHSNMNNNSNARVASKRFWLQKAQSNWVFLTWSLFFFSIFFVTILLLLFLFSQDLHCITFMHFMIGCFCYSFYKYIIIKKGKGRKNVFCVISLGLVIIVDHIIFT